MLIDYEPSTHILLNDVIEDPDFTNTQPVLRSTDATQSLNPAFARPFRLVSEMPVIGPRPGL